MSEFSRKVRKTRTCGLRGTTVTQSLQPCSRSSPMSGLMWTATFTQQSSPFSMVIPRQEASTRSRTRDHVSEANANGRRPDRLQSVRFQVEPTGKGQKRKKKAKLGRSKSDTQCADVGNVWMQLLRVWKRWRDSNSSRCSSSNNNRYHTFVSFTAKPSQKRNRVLRAERQGAIRRKWWWWWWWWVCAKVVGGEKSWGAAASQIALLSSLALPPPLLTWECSLQGCLWWLSLTGKDRRFPKCPSLLRHSSDVMVMARKLKVLFLKFSS